MNKLLKIDLYSAGRFNYGTSTQIDVPSSDWINISIDYITNNAQPTI